VARRLDWKRGVSDEISTSRRMTWESRCQRFRVQRSESKYGLGTTFYAMMADGSGGWTMLARKPTRNSAEATCELEAIEMEAKAS
jgi:hypothetical protein